MDRIMSSVHNRSTDQLDYWFGLGDFPRCVALLKTRVELDTTEYEAWTDLIWMLGNVEEREEQMAAAIRFHTVNAQNPDAYFPQGQLLFQQRQFVAVVALLEKALALKKPMQRNNYVLLAQSWRRLGLPRQSIRVWNRQLEQFPDDPKIKSDIARAQEELAGQRTKSPGA